jgi:RNA polymerase sigma-70 factor (ECF subfamily)
LFRVAYHEALAYRRRQAVGEKVVRRVAWQQISTGSNSNSSNPNSNGAAGPADEPLARFESVQAVRAALDELPPEQRQVVRMRVYEEKTFTVIAQELSIPLGTALARMRSAIIKLRAKLDQNTPEGFAE